MTEPLILKDKDVFPTLPVLENVLKESFPAYEEFINRLSDLGFVPEWNYYNDGKAWLCKLLWKKKNLGWLYVYNGYFNISCFFTERHSEAIVNLDIDTQIKNRYFGIESSGKLKPLTIRIESSEQLPDTIKILLFKKEQK